MSSLQQDTPVKMGRTNLRIVFQTKTWSGGTGWYAQQLAEGLARAGAEVTFIAPPAEPIEREPRHPSVRRKLSARESSLGHSSGSAVKSLMRVWDGIRFSLAARVRAKHFLFSIPDPLVFFLPLLATLRLTGANVCLIVHDAVPHSWAKHATPPRVQRFFLALTYAWSNRLVVLTGAARDRLVEEFGIDASKIAVVPCGILDIGLPSSVTQNSRFLAFGAMRRNKRILETVKALQIARSNGFEASLHLAGEPDKADPEYWAACMKQIAEAPEGITLEAGYIAEDRINQLIADSDAGILAYEGFVSQSGVAVLLATAQRPIIGTSAGGIKDLFDLGVAGIPLQENIDEAGIALALQAFGDVSAVEWNDRCIKSRQLVLKELGWDVIGKRFVDLMSH